MQFFRFLWRKCIKVVLYFPFLCILASSTLCLYATICSFSFFFVQWKEIFLYFLGVFLIMISISYFLWFLSNFFFLFLMWICYIYFLLLNLGLYQHLNLCKTDFGMINSFDHLSWWNCNTVLFLLQSNWKEFNLC